MAKSREALATAEEVELSSKVQTAIDKVKAPFMAYVRGSISLDQKRRDLAGPFMKAFGAWQAETQGTFVDFVRIFVPDLPEKTAEYKAHSAYAAADYLRREAAKASRAARTGANNDGTSAQTSPQDRPAPAGDTIARLTAAIMQILHTENQQNRFLEIMAAELNWDAKRVENLKAQIVNVAPVVEIKGRDLGHLRLSAPAPVDVEEAAEAEA